MKNKFLRGIVPAVLILCLAVPAAMLLLSNQKAKAADALEEVVYTPEYQGSIIDLVRVKKAGEGTDIDGDATNGGETDLTQMRYYLIGKIDTFYRTQGVVYEYDEEAACYYVSSSQDCDAGINKAEGTLSVLSAYNDGTHDSAAVAYLDENAFSSSQAIVKAVLPETVTTLKGSTFNECGKMETVFMPGVMTLDTVDNFKDCAVLTTAVVADKFKLSGDNFSKSDAEATVAGVDIYVSGDYEPTLNMSSSANACLSGEIYRYNADGACGTWKMNEDGTDVVLTADHTWENGVCTNEYCNQHTAYGLAYDRNHFEYRTDNTVTVEQVGSYVTEKNVAKITTTYKEGENNVGDIVIDLPKDVTSSLTVRLLVADSDATHIMFRTVGADGNESKFDALGVACSDIAPGRVLTDDEKNVWLDYTIDYSYTHAAYKDRLTIQVGGGETGGTHTFYVAYAVNTEDIKAKLAADLANNSTATNCIADFSSNLYQSLISDGNVTDTITTTWLPSFEGEEGVLKIEAGGAWNTTRDFVIDLPKSHSGNYTLRMYIPTTNVVGQLGTGTSTGWGTKVLNSPGLDEWRTVIVNNGTTDEGYNKQKIRIQGFRGGANAGTMTVYLSWILDGTANITTAEEAWRANTTASTKATLSANLQSGYLADFSAEGYQNLIFGCSDVNRTPASITSTWLESYTDASSTTANGVLKTEITMNSLGIGDFLIELPKGITQDAVTLRYAMVYGDGEDSNDALRFKVPEDTDIHGMSLAHADRKSTVTSAPGYDLIGDGSFNTVRVNWNCTVKDYLEFQLGTGVAGEKVTIYFDFVYDGIPAEVTPALEDPVVADKEWQ